jgi:hypothetical protein
VNKCDQCELPAVFNLTKRDAAGNERKLHACQSHAWGLWQEFKDHKYGESSTMRTEPPS